MRDNFCGFFFQELVHPYENRIPDNAAEKIRITNEMVKDAKEISEVYSDFADFIGDDVLVGFNCIQFDLKFLARVEKLSGRVITNQYYDVTKMAKEMYGKSHISLGEISEDLDIASSQANRTLADAITIARVYLKLLEQMPQNNGIDA